MTSNLGGTTAEQSALRINGTSQALTVIAGTTAGTGNYLAYPLYIGRRAGTSLPFTGLIFGLITRFGPNLTGTTINVTETWVADKTGINIANNISPTIYTRDNTAVLDRFNQIIERRA